MVGSFLNFIGGFSTAFIVVVSVVILLLIIALIVAVFFKKRLIRALERSRRQEGSQFKREISKIKQSRESPENKFASIDRSARSFLSKKYRINKNMDYSEIVKHFAKKDRAIEGFSKKMIEGIYSGEKMNEQKVKALLDEFEYIVQRKESRIYKEVRVPKLGLYKEGRKIVSKLSFAKKKAKTSGAARARPAAGEEKAPETAERTREEKLAEVSRLERENYHRQLMNSKALSMISRLNLQKVVLQRAFEEGFIKEKVYGSSMRNIDTVMRKLKEKYL